MQSLEVPAAHPAGTGTRDVARRARPAAPRRGRYDGAAASHPCRRPGDPLFDGRPGVPDRFGRALRDLRISVTDRCNFRCPYCMPAEVFGRDFAFLPHDRS